MVQVSRAENVILIYCAACQADSALGGAQLKAQHGIRGYRGGCTCVMPLTYFPHTKHLHIMTS